MTTADENKQDDAKAHVRRDGDEEIATAEDRGARQRAAAVDTGTRVGPAEEHPPVDIPAPHEASADVGVVGMAVMGSNLARNLARHGYAVAIYDHWGERTVAAMHEHGSEGTFIPSGTIEDFVRSLKRPRSIILLVKAGEVTDQVLDTLTPLLDKGDVVIDGGNSFFEDTRRREAKLAGLGLNFVGAGVSGGEVGALEGPSIMPGGPDESYEIVGPMLENISAHVGDEPCCTHIGHDGSGHFVKMVHNGIEYADMQFIGEAYEMLRAAGFSLEEVADVFEQWNSGDLDSYLIGITSDALRAVDAKTGRPLIDMIVDASGMKGTGTWAVQSALDLASPVNAIAEAVFARAVSSDDELRAHGKALAGPDRTLTVEDRKAFVDDVRDALWSSKVVAYAQGLDEIRLAAREYGWNIDMAEIAKIWRAGCIIRAKLLDRIRDEYAAHDLVTLLEAPSIEKELARSQAGWRRTVGRAVAAGVPVPGFAGAVSYYDMVRAPRLDAAALIQILRDYFGSHTYRRTDAEGSFHTLWSGDRSEIAVD